MKPFFYTTLLLLALANQFTMTAQWQWAYKGMSAIRHDAGRKVATDPSGNVYAVGEFSSLNIDFSPFVLNNVAEWIYDMFLVKYSPTGTVLWATRAGGTNNDFGKAVTTDAAGNVFITGYYSSSIIIFGTDTLRNTAGVGTDIYTVKYSPTGTVIWARAGSGIDYDNSVSMCTDATGNVFIAGYFNSPSLTFGPFTIFNSSINTNDIFIVKYDPAGNVLWARDAGGAADDGASCITADVSGNIIITGGSRSPVSNFGTVTLTNPGISSYTDVVTVKYDSNGNAIWGRSGAGEGSEVGAGVSTDNVGNIYVTGNFNSIYTVFGNDTLRNAQTYTGGTTDIFIVKYDTAGTGLWAKRAGTRFFDEASGIVSDGGNYIYITGNFNDSTITFGGTSLSNVGSADIFVAKYNVSGTPIQAYASGGTNTDRSHALCIDGSGNVFITGDFYSNAISFGSTTLLISLGGYSDVFVAKLALQQTGISENVGKNNISVFPNPNSGIFKVSIEKYNEANIKIMNTLGEIVYQSKTTSIKAIDLSYVSKGLYIVQVTDQQKNTMTQKIIIE